MVSLVKDAAASGKQVRAGGKGHMCKQHLDHASFRASSGPRMQGLRLPTLAHTPHHDIAMETRY